MEIMQWRAAFANFEYRQFRLGAASRMVYEYIFSFKG